MLEFLFYKACNFIKKRLQHRCFAVNIVGFLKHIFFEKHPRAAASSKDSHSFHFFLPNAALKTILMQDICLQKIHSNRKLNPKQGQLESHLKHSK